MLNGLKNVLGPGQVGVISKSVTLDVWSASPSLLSIVGQDSRQTAAGCVMSQDVLNALSIVVFGHAIAATCNQMCDNTPQLIVDVSFTHGPLHCRLALE